MAGTGGKRAGAGRPKGKANRSTEIARELAATMLPDYLEEKLWNRFLNSKDERIAWDAFKFAKMYKSGKPFQTLAAEKDTEITVKIIHVGHRNSAAA